MSERNPIYLNELFKLQDLEQVRIRLNLMFRGNWNPTEVFKNEEQEILIEGHYWNHKDKKYFKEGQLTLGFIRLQEKDLWLFFHAGVITKDLNKVPGLGYEFEDFLPLQKYIGRLIIRYHNSAQTMVRRADNLMDQLIVHQILPDVFNEDEFQGYDKVNLSWADLQRVVKKENWRTALRNQKAVYLLSDSSNGKFYVGSAYGDQMLLGRWESYLKTGHGGNVELKKLGKKHIQEHFRYSILDIYKSSTPDKVILEREAWWKETLGTRRFGYNAN